MNQILITKDEKGVQVNLMKPVVKFFAIVAIIFSIILIGEGIFNLYGSLRKNNSYIKPTLSAEKYGSDIEVSINSEVGINKVMYSWNNGEQIEYKGEGKKIIKFETAIPAGNNKLKITVLDVEGNKTKFEEIPVAFTEADDTIKPKISIENAKGKLAVTATDETEIDYLTYQWEGEEATKVSPNEDDKTTIKQEIEVQKGTKKLTIVAADKTGNTETVTKKIVGSNGPEIKATVSDGKFVVKVTDEYKITKIVYTLNDKEVTVENIPENAKEYEFDIPLEDVEVNYLKINAYENGIMTEYKCKKTK